MSRLAALVLLLAGCYVAPAQPTPTGPPPPPAKPACYDNDRDGYCADQDCNDNDPSTYPGAQDILADGVDQNCDGTP